MKSRFWLLGNRPKGSPTSAVHRYGHLRKHESASQTGRIFESTSRIRDSMAFFPGNVKQNLVKPPRNISILKVFTIQNLNKNRIIWRFLLLCLGFVNDFKVFFWASDGFSLKHIWTPVSCILPFLGMKSLGDRSWSFPSIISDEFAYYKPWFTLRSLWNLYVCPNPCGFLFKPSSKPSTACWFWRESAGKHA